MLGSTIFFLIFIPFLAFVLLGLSLLLGPHSAYTHKSAAFECGFSSFRGQNRTEFSISFFIFGLLFLLFDLEILLIFPFGLSSYNNSSYGLFFVLVFILILTAGFVFEFAKNALEIKSRQTGYLESSNAGVNLSFYPPREENKLNLYKNRGPKGRRFYSTASKDSSPPFPVYTNAEEHKSLILKANKGRAGVYCWTNLINGKSYIGSSASLGRRLGEYYSTPKLVRHAEIGNSIICKALLRYGFKNFKLEILCYCEPNNVLLFEQYFINSLKPEYNILQVAGSPLGHKHNEETLEKLRGPKSPEHLAKLRENIAKINIDRVFSKELRLKISKAPEGEPRRGLRSR